MELTKNEIAVIIPAVIFIGMIIYTGIRLMITNPLI